MIRFPIPGRAKREAFSTVLLSLLLSLSLAPPSFAQQQSPAKPGAKPAATTSSRSAAKPDAKSDSKTDPKGGASKAAKGKEDKGGKKVASLGDGKPMLLDTFHDWTAYMAQGKEKTCYALASPKDRAPATLQRDPAYVFISSRPSENVRNEVSIIMGFPMKDNAEAKAEIGNSSYDLIAKGSNAWVKNPAQENQFIEALKRSAKLIVKAPSSKGKVTTDSYSLAGLSQALDRVHKECQ